MGIRQKIKQPLISYRHKQYENRLLEKKISYDKWIHKMEDGKLPSHGNPSDEDLITDGIYFVKTVPGELAAGAKEKILREFARHPETVIVYTDEDIMDSVRRDPWFKPDWSPDTFLSRFYLGGFIAIRQSALPKGLTKQDLQQNIKQLCFQVTKENGGFERHHENNRAVLHLSEVLFHRHTAYCEEERIYQTPLLNQKDVQRQTAETGILVSLIIPSKDNVHSLLACIQSFQNTVHSVNYEIIVVDNGSKSEVREQLENKSMDFRYLYEPMEFNFAKMCNLGASYAKGKFLLFLNDDIECAHSGWLEEMLEAGEREYVGAVGCKLLYPNLTNIQHAGITNLPMGPVHKLQFLDDSKTYYFDANRGNRDVLAVTGACLLIRREYFDKVGRMNEELKVAFNDVELCFSLYEQGLYNVVVNDVFLYHHESMSRGNDESAEKWMRLMEEKRLLYDTHPLLKGKDPFYSEYLNREGLDTRILPGYVCADSKPLPATPYKSHENMKNVLQDECLLVRLEECREGKLSGYGVVLGSDNSLFKKVLLLKNENGEIWELTLLEKYRSDLEENMTDQINVALSGFAVIIEEKSLPEGVYQVGMLAKDRTSRLKIMNWTHRFLDVKGNL